MKLNKGNFIISGGGTGGHIYPALSIADGLKQLHPDAKIHFVGARGRMEMEKVPAHGYSITGLWISGIQRSLTLKNLSFPFKLLASIWKAFWLIRKFRPQAVIGTGGFASGPTLYVAARLGIPTLIQEQNSYPGITNRWLASKVDKVCVAYPGLDRWFPDEKLVFTGNPVRKDLRKELLNPDQGKASFGINPEYPCLLVMGGSLGARAINNFLGERLDWFLENKVQLIWQCGKFYAEASKAKLAEKHKPWIQVHPFLSDMPLAYSAADLVISRAGACTLSELCLAGKPAVLIPSPNVAEDHQTRNAEALANDDAAVMVTEDEIELRLMPVLRDLLNNADKRNQLSQKILTKATPKAVDDILDQIQNLIHAK